MESSWQPQEVSGGRARRRNRTWRYGVTVEGGKRRRRGRRRERRG